MPASLLPRFPRLSFRTVLAAAGLVLSGALLGGTVAPRPAVAQSTFGQPQIGSVRGSVPLLTKVQVKDYGRVVYTGPMNLNPTLDRIRRGTKLSHNNDGSVFGNYEKRLPVKTDKQYYREFVHTTYSPSFPGPQRVVIGKTGEVFYTGDHYATFKRVNP